MANTNWFKGIDELSSTPGGTQVSLANHVFVDQSFVGVSDGSPDAPYNKINDAIVALGPGSAGTVVIASGTYSNEDSNAAIANFRLVANTRRSVTITGTGNQWMCNGSTAIFATGIIFDGIRLAQRARDTYYIDCEIRNITQDFNIGAGSIQPKWDYSQLIDCTYRLSYDNTLGDIPPKSINSTFINVAFEDQDNTKVGKVLKFENCDFDTQCVWTIHNNTPVNDWVRNNCHFRGTIINSDAGSTSIPESNPLAPQDPLYVGNPDLGQFLIQSTSTLIGAGTNKSTIGAFRLGELENFSGATINDLQTSPTIEVVNNESIGDAETVEKTLPRVYKSPIGATINGIVDTFENAPKLWKGGYPIPNVYTVRVTYRETVGGGQTTKDFIYGLPYWIDDSGRSTAETDSQGTIIFDSFDIDSEGDLFRANRATLANSINVEQIITKYVLERSFPYDNYGATEFEFSFFSPEFFNLSGNPESKIDTLFDQSGNGFDVLTTGGINEEPGALPFEHSNGRRGFNTKVTGIANFDLQMTSFANSNFLHQGADDWCLYFECDFDSSILAQNTAYGIGTGNFNSTGIEVFYRNNTNSEAMELRFWNGSNNLGTVLTPNNSVDTNNINYVMITFNSSTRELIFYLNAGTPISIIITNNFSAGNSVRPFTLGDWATPGNGFYIGDVTCWKGTILSQANFNEIRAARQKYYANTP